MLFAKKRLPVLLLALLLAALTLTACGTENSQAEPSAAPEESARIILPTTPAQNADMPDFTGYYDVSLSPQHAGYLDDNMRRLDALMMLDAAAALEGAIEAYGAVFSQKLPKDVLVCALGINAVLFDISRHDSQNLCGLTQEAMDAVDMFLEKQGASVFDYTNPEQNIAAFAIAAILNYQEDFPSMNDTKIGNTTDLGGAFALARYSDEEGDELFHYAESFWDIMSGFIAQPELAQPGE